MAAHRPTGERSRRSTNTRSRWTDATVWPEMSRLQLYNTRTRAKQTCRGFAVRYVQNITDVDDKIIHRARELRIDASDLDTPRAHRRNTRFADADRIRDQLAARGVILEDSATGVRRRRSSR
jgi:cysteinyl-tRNA synthetase